jgi:hypothetical protein
MIFVIRSTNVDQCTSAKTASAVNEIRVRRDGPEQLAAQWSIDLRAQCGRIGTRVCKGRHAQLDRVRDTLWGSCLFRTYFSHSNPTGPLQEYDQISIAKNLSFTPICPPVTPVDPALTITRSLGTPYVTNYGDQRLNVWSLIVWDPPVNIWPIRLNDPDRT